MCIIFMIVTCYLELFKANTECRMLRKTVSCLCLLWVLFLKMSGRLENRKRFNGERGRERERERERERWG